jgi:acetyltransferase-like isoleucine patch superfamily enzyme
MPITIANNGANNTVNIEPQLIESGSGTIILDGDNNSVTIKSPVYAVGIYFQLTGGATIEIDQGLSAGSLFVYATKDTKLHVGQTVGFNGAVRLLMHEPGQLSVGDGCLFAGDTDVSISDMHSIVDADTGRRINHARDITICDHVWIGQRCIVLKGVKIGAGSVIGAGSIVARDIPPRCVATGNPARVVRRNATWDFRLL